jgi:hypothetical protein
MDVSTVHENSDGEQTTTREVAHEGETYEFEVERETSEHTYVGDAETVPDEVVATLRDQYGPVDEDSLPSSTSSTESIVTENAEPDAAE